MSLAECAAYPIAAPMQNTGSRLVIDIACKASGVHLKPVLETNSIPLRFEFLLTSNGITFIPRISIWGKLQAGELRAVPIRDRVANSSTIDAVTHVSRQLPLAAEEFLRAVQGDLQALRASEVA